MTGSRPRWQRTLYYSLPMLLILFAVLTLLQPADAYDPEDPSTWNWTIAGESVEYRNGTVLLDENITVGAGGQLSLLNVTVVFNCSFPGEYNILVKTDGELAVVDLDLDPSTKGDASVIRARWPWIRYEWVCEVDSKLLIRASEVRDCGMFRGSEGLLIETDSAFIINTTITKGYSGLIVRDGSVYLENSIVSDHATYGIVLVDSSAYIRGCQISNTTHVGITIVDSPIVRIWNSTVRDHGIAGIRAQRSTVDIEDCQVVNCTEYGIDLREDSTGLIARCIVDDMPNVGINLVQVNDVGVIDCQITRADDGISLYYTEPILILRTIVNECLTGIHSIHSPVIIMDSVFDDCGSGIVLSNSDPFTITRCTFENNSHGVYAGGAADLGSDGIVENCTFRSNTYTGISIQHSGVSILNGTFSDNWRWAINCDTGGTVGWYVGGVSSAVNDTIRLRGTIKVQYGGNLSLINTTVVVGDMDAVTPIDVYKGTLRLLDGDGDPDTIYDNTRLVHTNPGPLDHYYVGGVGDIIARNAVFDSMTLLSVNANLTVTGCDFSETKYGIHIPNDEPGNPAFVSGCTFADSHFGIHATKSPLSVINCTFSRLDRGISISTCNRTSLSDLWFINCDVGIYLHGGADITVDDISTLGCGNGLYSKGVTIVSISNSVIKQSSKHGLRLFNTSAVLEDVEVTTSGAGGIVVDDSMLTLDSCTIHSNERVGLMGNLSNLVMNASSITSTDGIGIWWTDDADDLGEISVIFEGCFLDTGAAYDVRFAMSTVGMAYNTHLDPDDVRILDNSLLRIMYDLDSKVQVMGKDPIPPTPVAYQVADHNGTIVDLGTMTDPVHLPKITLPAYQITSMDTTTFIPYVVTATVVGRDWSNTTDLGIGATTIIWVELDIVPVIDVPEVIPEGIEVTLDATGTICYPFALSRIEWDIEPDAAPGTDLIGLTLDWTFPSEGSYEVMVKLFDIVGNSNSMTIEITVTDSTASAEIITSVPDQVTEDEPFTLEGRYISAVDEVIILEWDFGDGMKANTTSVTHTWTRDGEYNVTFTVVEADGSYSEAAVVITVTNAPPVAVIKAGELEVSKRERFDLDGSLSYDTPSDNGSLRYLWDMGGEPFLTAAQAFWRFEEAGVYDINLMVLDDDGAWDRATIKITVFNQPPTFGPIPKVRLNDTDTTWSFKLAIDDPDDDLLNLTLNTPEFEPGGAFSMRTERDNDGVWTLHVKPIEGREGRSGEVTLTVTDPDGGTASSTVEIFVDKAPVDTGSMLWLILAAALVLVVLTVVYYRLARRQVPPPPEPKA